MKTALWTTILLGLLSTQLWATEASMCKTISNTTCSQWDSVDYTIPSGQQISKTYIHYEGGATEGMRFDCYGVNGDGSTGSRKWTINNTFCGCGNTETASGHPIVGQQTIRLRMYHYDCPGQNCAGTTAQVWFYTSATAATCPPACTPK